MCGRYFRHRSEIGSKFYSNLQSHSVVIAGLHNIEPTEKDFRKVGTELSLAFSKIGFVYLTGHGIVEDVIDDAMQVSKEFFEFEEGKKSSISRPSPLSRDGWVSQGRETFTKVSHQYD